jgi:hypothetical protein
VAIARFNFAYKKDSGVDVGKHWGLILQNPCKPDRPVSHTENYYDFVAIVVLVNAGMQKTSTRSKWIAART